MPERSDTIVERIPWCEPASAAEQLRPLGGLAFLDSAMRHPRLGRYSYVAVLPFGRLTAEHGQAVWNGTPITGAPLDALGALMSGMARASDPLLPPFQGGAVGTLPYDLGLDLHGLPRLNEASSGLGTDVELNFYDTVLAFDHESMEAWIVAAPMPQWDHSGEGNDLARKLAAVRSQLAAGPTASAGHKPVPRHQWRSNFDGARYRAAVAEVIAAILEGEIFQANVAQRFRASMPPGYDPWQFYTRLRSVNPAPFAAYLDQGSRIIASSSPELFLTLDGDRVETRPIKGTARRVADLDQDERIAARLLASEKDRAENTMIVDLLRNDLSRVCRPHSVEVPTLCGLESYAGIHHLVSSVTGQLKPGISAVDLIGAAFPGGSITGAPKHQAMRVISRTEETPRGTYCGSLAWFGFDGAMAASIAIRTVTFEDGHAMFHAGGGVTALSDPDAEYEETLTKAEGVFRAFEAP